MPGMCFAPMGVTRSLPVTQDPLIPPMPEHRTVPEPPPWTFLCPPPAAAPCSWGQHQGTAAAREGLGPRPSTAGSSGGGGGGSPLLSGSPLPTLSHGLCSAVVVGSGWGSAPEPPPVEAPSPVRSQGSVTSAPFQQLHRSPSKASEGAVDPELSPPIPDPTRRLRPVQNSEFIASAAAPARPDPRGLPPAMGQREEQGLEGTENYRGGHRGGKRGAGAAVGTWGRRGTWLAPSCYRGRGRGAVLGGVLHPVQAGGGG